MRNIRKVQVNAQVTFAIYILETVALASVAILWFAIGKIELSTTLSFVSFYVVLPYTFLMNTPHNKNLITEHGFLNTIRNAIQMPCNFEKRTVEDGDGLAKGGNERQKHNKLDSIKATSKSHVKEISISLDDKLNHSSMENPDIYIISRSDKNAKWEHCNDDDIFNPQHDPCSNHSSADVSNLEDGVKQAPNQVLFAITEENLGHSSRSHQNTKWEHCNDDDIFNPQHNPCSNHSSADVSNVEEGVKQVPNQILFAITEETLGHSSKSDQNTKWDHCKDDDIFNPQHDPCSSHSAADVSNLEEGVKRLPEQIVFAVGKENPPKPTNNHLCLAEKILENMLKNVINEDVYSYYLRELIRLENANEQGGEALDQFEIIGLDDFIAPRHRKAKLSKTKLKTEEVDGYLGTKISNISQYEEYQRNTSQTHFLGRFLDRLDLRKDMLRRYAAHCKDKKSYRQLFDSILDLEEGLVM